MSKIIGNTVGTTMTPSFFKSDVSNINYYGDMNVVPTDSKYFVFDSENGEIQCITEGVITDGLTKLVIPYEINGVKVTKIFNLLTYDDKTPYNVSEVILPNTITELKGITFYDYYKLKSIKLPDSLISISGPSGRTFSGSGLKHISIPNGISSICMYTFECPLEELYIPPTVTQIDELAFGDEPTLTIICDEGSYAEEYAKTNGINYMYRTSKPLGDKIGKIDSALEEIIAIQNRLMGVSE